MSTSAAALPEHAVLAGKVRALSWAAQLVAAAILAQTLFFKFSGAAEAKAIFEPLGVEPWGRIGLGVVELITVLLMLVPRTAALGGAVAVGLMLGAIGSHLTVLGIEHEGDGGLLFVMAWITLIAGAAVTWVRRHDLSRLRP